MVHIGASFLTENRFVFKSELEVYVSCQATYDVPFALIITFKYAQNSEVYFLR